MSVVQVMVVELVLLPVALTLETCGVPEAGRVILTSQLLFTRLRACLNPSADGDPLDPPCNFTTPLLKPPASRPARTESTTGPGSESDSALIMFSFEHPEMFRFVRFKFP